MYSTENCAACRAPLKPDARFCGKCGTPRENVSHTQDGAEIEGAPKSVATCPNCGRNATAPGGRFCRACGHRLRAPAAYVEGAPASESSPGSLQAGEPLAESPSQTQVLSRSRTAAMALAFGVVALTLAAGVTGYWLASDPAATGTLPTAQTSASAPGAAGDARETPRADASQEPSIHETPAVSAAHSAAEPPVPLSAVQTTEPRPDQASGPTEHAPTLREGTRQRAVERPSPSRDTVAASSRPFDDAARTALLNDAAGSSITPSEPQPVPAPADSQPRGRTASQAEASLGAARTIDQLFQQRVAAECESGLLGFVCREKVRFGLCRDRWTSNEQAGMTACRVLARQGPRRDQ